MKTTLSPTVARWASRAALGTALVVSLSGVYAFKTLFARPGEAALRLAPADSLAVVTLDLTPSPGQAMTFKKIDDALARNGMEGVMDKSLLDMMEAAPSAAPLRELVQRSGAAFMLRDVSGKGMTGGIFLALSDSARAQEILQKGGRPEYWKGTRYYRLKGAHMAMMVVDDLLVLADKPWVMHSIDKARTGVIPAVTAIPAFAQAREKAPEDANLLVMVSPKATAEGKSLGLDKLGKEWITASAAIRDGGIALQSSGRYDLAKAPELAALTRILPLRADLAASLPKGAYGVVAMAQPGAYYESSLNANEETKKLAKEGEEGLAKETGISLKNDLVPALTGNAVLAAYPGKNGAGGEFLMVLDDAHGADPAAVAHKFQDWINRKAKEDKDGPGAGWMVSIPHEGATAFRLADKVEEDMRKDLAGPQDGPVRTDALVAEKTVAWAYVDKAFLIATSQDVLNRAIASYRTKADSLASDPGLSLGDTSGDQTLSVFSLSRIAKGVRNTMDLSKLKPSDRKTAEQALALFEGLDTPLSVKGGVRSDGTFSGSVFIPIDYDKALDFVGEMKGKA